MLSVMAMNTREPLLRSIRTVKSFTGKLVSNACLIGAKWAELIPFMPYKKNWMKSSCWLLKLRAKDMAKYSWIQFAREDGIAVYSGRGAVHESEQDPV